MIAYQLAVFPTEETLNYLKHVFSECPFDIYWDQLFVELNLSADSAMQNVVDTTTVYDALPGNPNESATNRGICQLYEPALEMTNLYLPLTSDSLYDRAYVLRHTYKPLFHPTPYIYLCLKRGYHSCISYNTYVNAVSDYFVNYPDKMTFCLETVRALDVVSIEDQMLYQVNGL